MMPDSIQEYLTFVLYKNASRRSDEGIHNLRPGCDRNQATSHREHRNLRIAGQNFFDTVYWKLLDALITKNFHSVRIS